MVEPDEIDLITLWLVVWRAKWSILLACALCGAVAIALALTATPLFRAEVVVTEVKDGGMNASSSIANQLGGLASLAGISVGGNGSSQQYQAVLRSRHLIEEFVTREHILNVLIAKSKQPSLWFAVNQFRDNVLSLHEDKIKGTTVVGIEWTDPQTAARWANAFVALANEVIRSRALSDSERNIAYLNGQISKSNVVELQRVMYSLIESETKTLMLANARAEYAFSVVDPAVPPEIRTSPKRTLMVALGIIVGLFIGILNAFVRFNLRRRSAGLSQVS